MTAAATQQSELWVDGAWRAAERTVEIRSPYDGALAGVAALADPALVDVAVASAAAAMREDDFPAHARAEVLERVAALIARDTERIAHVLTSETGKPIKQSRGELERAQQTFKLSALEARRLRGETIPMDAVPTGVGKLAFTVRVPIGVVAAITPFNFPINLAAHKLGPAFAAGCAVVLKPAEATPLATALLVELLLEAGLPPRWIQLVNGGPDVGARMVEHPDVAAVSFTGSAPVGWRIRAAAPSKRVALELGANAPLIVHDDGDWAAAADRTAIHGYSYAGQSCISVQRVLVHAAVAEPFTARLLERVSELRVGDPLDEATDVGPVIDARSRDRVCEWIAEAVELGGTLLTGGTVAGDGTLAPALLRDVPAAAKAWEDEVFGPLVCVNAYEDFEQAIEAANSTRFGLQAGVFTASLARALRAAEALEFGGVIVNDVPTYRADHQPYGGIKESGNTREGPEYAVREFTEERFVSLQP